MKIKQIIHNAWVKYRARKSKIGIITDFFFLFLVLVFLIHPLRFGISVYLSRLALTEPNVINETYYMSSEETMQFRTATGCDTTILGQFSHPTIINFGCTTNPRSCAELKSLNKLWAKYSSKINVYFITDENPADVEKYFTRHDYTLIPLFYNSEDFNWAGHDIEHELQASVPATLVIGNDGQIAIKKFGAAKWTGEKVEHIIDSLITTSKVTE